MKELEKLIPKKCGGVSPMIVKELVQQMIDEDGLITVEKCGNINVYWCFKNQIIQKVYDSCMRLSTQINQTTEEIQSLKEKISDTKSKDRCPLTYDARGEILFNREDKLRENLELEVEAECLKKRCVDTSEKRWSASKITEKRECIMNRLNAITSCTDDIEIITDYFSQRYNIDKKLIKKELEIPEEFIEFDIQFCSL